MWLWLLAGCGTNWVGTWDMDYLELSAEGAALTHGDMGWISCDDRLDCYMLRRYDIDMSDLTVEPRADALPEYSSIDDDESVVWSWGGAMQLQLDVVESTQTWIHLEGRAAVIEASPFTYLDVRLELVR